MKICSKCKEEKPRKEFHRDKRSPDGRRYQCKVCRAEYQQSPIGKAARVTWIRKYNLKNAEAIKASKRKYYLENTEAIKARVQEYQQTEAGKATNQRSVAKWDKKNPEKIRAQQILQKAVQSGQILKPSTCSECNEPTDPKILHGHHEDYSKPLDVDWVCPQCHKDLHRQEAA